MIYQQRREVIFAVVDCDQHRREFVLRFRRIHVGAGSDQNLARFDISLACCVMQRRHTPSARSIRAPPLADFSSPNWNRREAALTFAPRSMSNLATVGWFSVAANIRGVYPLNSSAPFTLAPRSINSFTALRLPVRAASIRGVSPAP